MSLATLHWLYLDIVVAGMWKPATRKLVVWRRTHSFCKCLMRLVAGAHLEVHEQFLVFVMHLGIPNDYSYFEV